jgi:pyrimidine-specific ribonucleoside hydrolase
MLDLVWDMETQDPDDFLTLLLLLGHPDVNLKAVTITPGSAHQVGLVRRALGWFGRDLPVGAGNLDHHAASVSAWHYQTYGDVPPSREAEPAVQVLLRCCDEHTTLLTGAPLKNFGAALRNQEQPFRARRLVAQGGFAGVGVVPPECQLDKFRGRTTCPSFNLNGDPKTPLLVQSYPGIAVRRFVSKNVCHGVVYDAQMHRRFAAVKQRSRSLTLIWQGMERYLERRPEGKAFHDPLAACCAIDETIAAWAEVELYREKGEWGSRLKPGSGTWIITRYDHERFVEVLTRCG